MSIDRQRHWENVYSAKSPEEMSWYEPHLATSLAWIEEAASDLSAAILDVGGGASTLVDDLHASGYRSLTVLDVSEKSMAHARRRLGAAADAIEWITQDVTNNSLPEAAFEIWHDRAVFHFLTAQAERDAYVQRVASALKPSGHLILATFSIQGPRSCSGLPVRRYDKSSIQEQFGAEFQLKKSATITHRTPAGDSQEFLYCSLARR